MPRWPAKNGDKPPRPTHLSELCSECGLYPVLDYAAWSCEHGTWNLADDFADPEAEELAEATAEPAK